MPETPRLDVVDALSNRRLEYLTFTEWPNPSGGSTRYWVITSTKHGDTLATIKWFGRWRQYALHPVGATAWNIGCLTEVNRFISEAMNDWRTKRVRAVQKATSTPSPEGKWPDG